MFYENKGFIIDDVFRVNRKAGTLNTKARDFSGLAFRLSGKSVFTYGKNYKTYANEGSISYIPQGIDFKTKSETEEIIILHLKEFGSLSDKIISFVPKNYELFADLFETLENEWQKRETGYKNRCTALLYTIFENIEKDAEKLHDKKTDLLKNGVIYMNRYFDDPELTVKKLADMCNISEVYFRKIYKIKYHTSPLKTINDLRLKRACGLLKSGYYSILQTASLSGFSDVKYFSTLFKKTLGVSPSEYIKTKFEL